MTPYDSNTSSGAKRTVFFSSNLTICFLSQFIIDNRDNDNHLYIKEANQHFANTLCLSIFDSDDTQNKFYDQLIQSVHTFFLISHTD